jgi:hypothetical protein
MMSIDWGSIALACAAITGLVIGMTIFGVSTTESIPAGPR